MREAETRTQDADLFAMLRNVEQGSPGRPRIGDSATLAEEAVRLGQNPFAAFPASNISGIEQAADGTPTVYSRFLGFFGPQGALPLDMTIEALQWLNKDDPSFARFADLFGTRFLQLFFRAWADARPIAQFDRPGEDRFAVWLASLGGFGSPAMRDLGGINDTAKPAFAGLVAAKVKSASRLVRLLRGVLGVDVEIGERIATWLVFEPEDQSRLGRSNSTLGGDIFLGRRVVSIEDKVRICLKTRNMADYRRFLPGQNGAAEVFELVFFYTGHRQDFEIELALPAGEAAPLCLGRSGELGWTGWMAASFGGDGGPVRRDARFGRKA